MRKIFKTIIVASLATLAMPLSASTMQTYTASSDTIDTTTNDPIATVATDQNTTVEPADTLREKLAQMETRMASMEQEQEMQKTWKRRKYWKIGITSPNLERTDGEEMKWKTNGSFFIQKGRTSYLHSKPIAGMIKFGIDYGFIDVTYSKLELKEISYSGESGTRASDGFDDIVSGDPDGDIGISELTGIDLGMHKIDYALHVGPSISVNPWNKLIATAYFHVMPTASSIIQNDNFSYGFGCMMAAGVSVAYKAISLGVEGVWGKIKYTQTDFGGDEDEEEGYDSDNSEDKSASLFNTEKFTLKQSGIRAYIAFRL